MTLALISEDIQQFGNFIFSRKEDTIINSHYLSVEYSSNEDLKNILNVCDDLEADFTEF